MLKLMYELYPLATKVRLSMLSEDKKPGSLVGLNTTQEEAIAVR